jgi:DegV family protein with EDD domain
MPRVAVVTDSTAYLPPGVAARHGVRVVPLQVVVAGEAHAEGEGVQPRDVAEALRSWQPVSTSRPSPEAFVRAYAAAAAEGAEAVVSVHLSAEMSGTVDSALLAARTADVTVEVVDSRSLGMGLGFAVLAAAEAAAAGEDAAAVAKAARRRAEQTRGLFYVDTLEHLRRGGRIGAAQAFFGSALSVKPLLHLVDGRIQPLEKVRTAGRAQARLEELAVRAAEELGGPVALAVHHLGDPSRAEALARRLAERTGVDVVPVSEVGAVVGAHVGPGMLAVVVAPG